MTAKGIDACLSCGAEQSTLITDPTEVGIKPACHGRQPKFTGQRFQIDAIDAEMTGHQQAFRNTAKQKLRHGDATFSHLQQQWDLEGNLVALRDKVQWPRSQLCWPQTQLLELQLPGSWRKVRCRRIDSKSHVEGQPAAQPLQQQLRCGQFNRHLLGQNFAPQLPATAVKQIEIGLQSTGKPRLGQHWMAFSQQVT